MIAGAARPGRRKARLCRTGWNRICCTILLSLHENRPPLHSLSLQPANLTSFFPLSHCFLLSLPTSNVNQILPPLFSLRVLWLQTLNVILPVFVSAAAGPHRLDCCAQMVFPLWHRRGFLLAWKQLLFALVKKVKIEVPPSLCAAAWLNADEHFSSFFFFYFLLPQLLNSLQSWGGDVGLMRGSTTLTEGLFVKKRHEVILSTVSWWHGGRLVCSDSWDVDSDAASST